MDCRFQAGGDGWLAAGSIGDRAAVWRSADGSTWSEDPLPASGPIDGIIDVSAYRVVPGRWATLLLGIEREPACEEDDDFCGKYQAAWSKTPTTDWARLPRATWILDRGYGVHAYPADEAGFLYLGGNDSRLSPDGWDWASVRQANTYAALVNDVVVTEDLVIGVGSDLGAAPGLVGWFGTARFSSIGRPRRTSR